MHIFECRLDLPVPVAGQFVFPCGLDTNEQIIQRIEHVGCEPVGTLADTDGLGSAFLFHFDEGQTPVIRFFFDEPGPGLAESQFEARNNRFEQPSQGLLDQVQQQFEGVELSLSIPMLMQFIGDRFTYGKRDQALGEFDDAMPPLECGLTVGSCVDMHTLAVAAVRGLGARASYLMGCHIAEGSAEGPTGHCWMNVRHPSMAHHWDISHHVQYGLPEITSAHNPKPGRRFGLSTGRGRCFKGDDGIVEFPSLSGFHALSGSIKGEKLRTIGRFLQIDETSPH